MNADQRTHLATTLQAVALAELGYFGYQAIGAYSHGPFFCFFGWNRAHFGRSRG
jgi:hypothetical protein